MCFFANKKGNYHIHNGEDWRRYMESDDADTASNVWCDMPITWISVKKQRNLYHFKHHIIQICSEINECSSGVNK